MRKMKHSGIDWLGEIPENWEIKRLKYLGSARNGLTYSPDDMTDEGILVLRSSNIQEGSLSFTDNVFVDMQISEELILKENDILICSRNGSRDLIGKCALIDKKTAGNTFGAFMCIFRSPYNHFIHYVFQSNLFSFYLGSYLTATVNQLTLANLNNMEIPITFDLLEQKIIVEYLKDKCKKIDTLISLEETAITELKEYKKSIIQKAVTKGITKGRKLKNSGIDWIGEIPEEWETLKIKFLATEQNTIFIDGDWIESPHIVNEGIRYLTTGNVGEGVYKEQGAGFITQKTFDELNCLKVYPEDLVISRLNEPIGRSCILPKDEEPFYIVAVDIVVLRPDKRHDKKYLMYVMNSPLYSHEAGLTAKGTTMQRISRTLLENIFLPIPPFKEQKEIAEYLDKKISSVDNLISLKQQKITELKEYKKSLIYEYVTGKKEISV